VNLQKKEYISIKGKKKVVNAVVVEGKNIVVRGKFIKIAFVKDEVCDNGIATPETIIDKLKAIRIADIFTFDQKLPETAPMFPYFYVWDNLAVLEVKSFKHWWNVQIGNDARRMVRKAEKAGVVVKATPLTDEMVIGIKRIYDESPIRQGKPFWHYKKDFETVKKENSTYLDRSEFIGAYFQNELIAFNKLFYTDNRADQIQLIAKLAHKDKSPINALISKAVEICSEKRISYLTYGKYHYRNKTTDSLSDFKKRNGFEKIEIPRYYVPLSHKGKIAIFLRLYKGPADFLPFFILQNLLAFRAMVYSLIFSSKQKGP
jgi:hypothetical protein